MQNPPLGVTPAPAEQHYKALAEARARFNNAATLGGIAKVERDKADEALTKRMRSLIDELSQLLDPADALRPSYSGGSAGYSMHGVLPLTEARAAAFFHHEFHEKHEGLWTSALYDPLWPTCEKVVRWRFFTHVGGADPKPIVCNSADLRRGRRKSLPSRLRQNSDLGQAPGRPRTTGARF